MSEELFEDIRFGIIGGRSYFSTKNPNICDIANFFSYIGYYGKIKKKFQIYQIQYSGNISSTSWGKYYGY